MYKGEPLSQPMEDSMGEGGLADTPLGGHTGSWTLNLRHFSPVDPHVRCEHKLCVCDLFVLKHLPLWLKGCAHHGSPVSLPSGRHLRSARHGGPERALQAQCVPFWVHVVPKLAVYRLSNHWSNRFRRLFQTSQKCYSCRAFARVKSTLL